MEFAVLVLLVLMGTGTYSMPTQGADQTIPAEKPNKQPAAPDTFHVVGRIMSTAFNMELSYHELVGCEVIFESETGAGIKQCYDMGMIMTCFEQMSQCFLTGQQSAKKAAGVPKPKDPVTVLGRAFDTPFALEVTYDEVQGLECEAVYVSGNGADVKRCYDKGSGATLYCFEQVNQCYLVDVDAGMDNGVS